MERIDLSVDHRKNEDAQPWFEIKGNGIFTTANHPSGPQALPWFEVANGKVFATENHPQGRQGLPWYEIHGNKMYTTISHPDGYPGFPLFEIRHNMIYGIPHFSPIGSPSTDATRRGQDRAIPRMKELSPPESKNGNDTG